MSVEVFRGQPEVVSGNESFARMTADVVEVKGQGELGSRGDGRERQHRRFASITEGTHCLEKGRPVAAGYVGIGNGDG